MATVYAVWHREERRFLGSPTILFNSSADATAHVNSRAKSKDGQSSKVKAVQTYDNVALTV
jgi:hypothetical protein